MEEREVGGRIVLSLMTCLVFMNVLDIFVGLLQCCSCPRERLVTTVLGMMGRLAAWIGTAKYPKRNVVLVGGTPGK